MPHLFRLTFQEQLELDAPLGEEARHDIERGAFPKLPPRDAAIRDDYRAFKAAPVAGGRLLVATATGGVRDSFGRAVLRATGCVLEPTDLEVHTDGGTPAAMRDLVAVWEALAKLGEEDGLEMLRSAVEKSSIYASDHAFARMTQTFERHSLFYADAATAFRAPRTELYPGAPPNATARAFEGLRASFAVMPRCDLRKLELAAGGEPSEHSESVLVLDEEPPPPKEPERRGLLDGLLGRGRDEDEPSIVDLRSRAVTFGGPYTPAPGTLALAKALANPNPWPDGSSGRQRYLLLLDLLDQGAEGAPRSLFEIFPELGALRRTIHDLERLSDALEQG